MIKFLDFKKFNNRFMDEIDERINHILDIGWYLQEDEYKKNEKNFAEYPAIKHCIGCKDWNHLEFPRTEEIHKTIISIPIPHVLTDDEVNNVVEVLNAY